jgi:23S rRNA pseudouridine1911/1915/1917 synthase
MKAAVEIIETPPDSRPQRIDRFLAQIGRFGSRARVQKLIEAGCVRIDGQPARCGQRVQPGRRIEVAAPPEPEPSELIPEAIPLTILFEDACLLVVNKPAGLVVHPAPTHSQGTLVHALLHHWQHQPQGLDPLRPGIVHRLDKDTSGLLVIAKDPETLASLARQFLSRTVEKEYLAAVWGRPARTHGVIDKPVGRDPVHRKKMRIRPDGRAAETRYEVIASAGPVSWLRVWPKTGRTHQIRVHLASLGHPIVGDLTYGRARKNAGVPLPERQALHAHRLCFQHPRSGETLEFCAPLPADLEPLWTFCTSPQDPAQGK